jgi:hypothetical protein
MISMPKFAIDNRDKISSKGRGRRKGKPRTERSEKYTGIITADGDHIWRICKFENLQRIE